MKRHHNLKRIHLCCMLKSSCILIHFVTAFRSREMVVVKKRSVVRIRAGGWIVAVCISNIHDEDWINIRSFPNRELCNRVPRRIEFLLADSFMCHWSNACLSWRVGPLENSLKIRRWMNKCIDLLKLRMKRKKIYPDRLHHGVSWYIYLPLPSPSCNPRLAIRLAIRLSN